jgi:uncharacterized membrane protein HdeD (DUF308 family)
MRSRAVPLPRESRQFPWWAGLLVGILAVVIGVLLILSPETTATYLFWILGIACLVGGVVALGSILFSRASWGWKLLAGILAITLGLALISQPLFSAYLVAAMALWVLGAVLMLAGMLLMVPAFSHMGWWYGVLGVFVVVIGVLLILGSVIGPLKAPWAFGIAAVVAGAGAVVAALRSRARPKDESIAISDHG